MVVCVCVWMPELSWDFIQTTQQNDNFSRANRWYELRAIACVCVRACINVNIPQARKTGKRESNVEIVVFLLSLFVVIVFSHSLSQILLYAKFFGFFRVRCSVFWVWRISFSVRRLVTSIQISHQKHENKWLALFLSQVNLIARENECV